MAFHSIKLSFNSGEWSPLLNARIDLDRYEHACQRLENFLIMPYGGALRRPGTQYLGKAKYLEFPCRLIGFNFSVSTNFVLEFGNLYVRFWTNSQQVMTPGSPTVPLEKATPYGWQELRELQYCQINDIMYVVHPAHPPHKLSRLADDNWTFAEVAFKWPPLLDENVTGAAITPSGISGDITLTANSGIFESGDVGSVWQIGHNKVGANLSYSEIALGVASGDSPSIRVRGPWTFTTYGTWKGEVRIVRAVFETGVTETVRTYNSSVEGQRNIAVTGTEDRDCSMHISFITGGVAGSSSPMARLEFAVGKCYGLVKITGYTSPTQVSGTVTWGISETTATIYWSQSAFSARMGYPRTVCLHEQRLLFGGTRRKPLSIHGSQIDDYENFHRGSAADEGFLFNLAANESNPINWLITQQRLLIGTAGDEWSLGPQNEDQAIGPGNVDAKQQSSFGSSYLQSRVVNEVVFFAQRQGKKIRELTFSFEKDGWVAPDLCQLAAHIAGEGFAETAFCQQPDAIFWCITKDGHLIGMTYERDQKVVGWHRHSTEGIFESVATIYGGDKADEVWLSVQREIEGTETRYIERFDPNFRPNFEAEDKNNYWYLDCAQRLNSAVEVDNISGLDYLEGKTVGILGDGANQPTRVVQGGAIHLQEPAKVVLVGLPFTSTLTPMNINFPPAQDGTSQGRKVRIHEVVIRFYKSLAGKFSTDGGKRWDEIFFRDRDDPMDTSPSIFTGDRRVTTGATYETQQAISIRQERPFPCCVLALILWMDFHGT
jgi:hypothetical protein